MTPAWPARPRCPSLTERAGTRTARAALLHPGLTALAPGRLRHGQDGHAGQVEDPVQGAAEHEGAEVGATPRAHCYEGRPPSRRLAHYLPSDRPPLATVNVARGLGSPPVQVGHCTFHDPHGVLEQLEVVATSPHHLVLGAVKDMDLPVHAASQLPGGIQRT